MDEKRKAYTYHEAGVAIVAMKLGYECSRVWIDPEREAGGACCDDPRMTDAARAKIDTTIA